MSRKNKGDTICICDNGYSEQEGVWLMLKGTF